MAEEFFDSVRAQRRGIYPVWGLGRLPGGDSAEAQSYRRNESLGGG